MDCNYCTDKSCTKKGKRNGKQHYYCKKCNRSFQGNYSYKAYEPNVNRWIKTLLKEGCGIRSIARLLKISKNTVLSRLLKLSRNIHRSIWQALGCSYEIDELWTFIHAKKHVIWIPYCIERTSKTVIDFLVGSRSKKNIGVLTDKVLSLQPKKISTDRLRIYLCLIPKAIHRVSKYGINRIERNHLTIRIHIKRLARRTICFSKQQNYLEAHLKAYFWR